MIRLPLLSYFLAQAFTWQLEIAPRIPLAGWLLLLALFDLNMLGRLRSYLAWRSSYRLSPLRRHTHYRRSK